MEVSVLEVQNVPSEAYISISSGAVRQQAQLEVGKPLLFPAQASKGKISVSLYENLGSVTMNGVEKKLGSEDVFVVPVKSDKGVTTEVKLRTRCPQGRSHQPEDVHGIIQAPSSSAWKYLGQNDLQSVVQSLIQEVLRDKPQDPYAFMAGKLKQHRGKEVSTRCGDQPLPLDSAILESRKSMELPAPNLDTLASQAIGAEIAALGVAREQAQTMLNALFAKMNDKLGPTFPERARAAKEKR
mmetsp:Transcript_65382/g.156333  ORF Transcript_65382/g.156333 Transcript_65382/m.156333 type:complete len:241 (-) Transcript_65382:223-945(-)